MAARLIMKLRVAEVRDLAGGVRLFTFRHPQRPELPPPLPGAHVDIRLPDGRVRQYSLCGDPDDARQYVIAVKREDDGRGGSRWVHDNLLPGTVAHVSAPRHNFRIASDADEHILVAGGIGITPLLAMAYRLRREGRRFVLHYCVRSAAQAPLLDEVRAAAGGSLTCHFSQAPGVARFDPAMLSQVRRGAHLYCCGPLGLVEDVRRAAANWPARHVHVEMFAPRPDNLPPQPFEIVLQSTGQVIGVPAGRSALDVLRDHGVRQPSSCEIGVCGACACRYVSGDVLHRDVVLDADERENTMLLCVSRANGRVVLDL